MEEQTSQMDLVSIVDDNLEEIISIIKEGYPDIDIFSRMRYTDSATVKKILDSVKEKHPGGRLFYVDIPYYGVVVYRSQTLKDTREVAGESVIFSDNLVKENGGADKIAAMDKLEQAKVTRSIQDQTNDFISVSMLKKCVLYPDNFGKEVEEETLPYGVAPTLVDVLAESSGFHSVRIEEV